MKEVFTKRRQLFLQQCAKYLKYVLNDHFVLFLLLGVGFVMVQYSQLLKNLPSNPITLHLFLSGSVLVLGVLGNFNAYLEKPDKQFLLTKELEVESQISAAKRRGFLMWSLLQIGVGVFLYPLSKGLGWRLEIYALLVLASLVIKWLIFENRAKGIRQEQLNWDRAIEHDRSQKQALLKFFSLFTQVKGISQTVKRRAYLDSLLKWFPKQTWDYLFARAFLRSGDYLTLTLRLVCLSLLSLACIGQDMVSTVLALLFNYLLLFQLLSLYNHYQYQYLTQIFPKPLSDKKKSLQKCLNQLFILVLILEGVAGSLFFKDKYYLVILLLGQFLMNGIYLPYKIKKLID